MIVRSDLAIYKAFVNLTMFLPQAPRLPVDRIREPWQVQWPAIVGYDHIWRHAVTGAALADERAEVEHACFQKKISQAAVHTAV